MRLLIVGTMNGQIGAAGQIAMSRGASVSHCQTIDEALAAMRSGQGAELMMVDVELDIKTLIDSLARERINIPVIGCGLSGNTEAAVRAINAGAREYIPLPPDADLIAAVLEAVAEDGGALIYKDPSMRRVADLAEQIAPSSASVLITGESGTGKELFARFIHEKSLRAKEKFVSVNCAAIPENLLESELFGHEKGAFTGAIARRIGKFEEADGGTLLLDEISEMDVRLQAKLLRAIQEREIDRVGGTQPIAVDIRIIATSNRDLGKEARAGRFREDLYFRLNVINLALPPLRDRPEDLALLTDHFIDKYSAMNDLPMRPISPDALAVVRSHFWRGNVRELENTIHRAVLLSRGPEISRDAIVLNTDIEDPDAMEAPASGTAINGTDVGAAQNGAATGPDGRLVGRTVADVERDLIIDTLYHCIGNRTHAANILGISIRTLRNKLKQYTGEGISVPMPGTMSRSAV
jgi:two-component system, response regulator FlrC